MSLAINNIIGIAYLKSHMSRPRCERKNQNRNRLDRETKYNGEAAVPLVTYPNAPEPALIALALPYFRSGNETLRASKGDFDDFKGSSSIQTRRVPGSRTLVLMFFLWSCSCSGQYWSRSFHRRTDVSSEIRSLTLGRSVGSSTMDLAVSTMESFFCR